MSTQLNRRRLLTTALAATAGSQALLMTSKTHAQTRQLVIRDPGGPFAEGFGDAFYKPFKEATGIEIVAATGQAQPTAFIKTMVETKNYTWDMAHVSNDVNVALAGMGHLEELKIDSHQGWKDLHPGFKSPFYAGVDVVGSVMAYRSDKFPAAKAPKTFKDVWDTSGFAGRRALRRNPMETLEYALLADGVAPDKLYPLDVDRAFKALDRIKKDVAVWWTSGAQTSQLLKSAEVDMCPTWNARAQVVADEGAPVAIMWTQFMYVSEGWVIPKGSPKADMCREFIRFSLDAKRQAVFTKNLAYGPTLTGAYQHIDPARARVLPTHPDNLKGGTEWNVAYWAQNRERITERFNGWVTA
jgi:putative spermidine/putrescine transport system substrate-binding protein